MVLRYLWVAGAPKIACYQVIGLRELGYDARLKILAVSPRYRGEYDQILKGVPHDKVRAPNVICGVERALNRIAFGEFREGERALPIYALARSICDKEIARSSALICHDPFSGIAGYIHRRLFNILYVIYVHEVPFGVRKFSLVEKEVLENADMILTVSDKISRVIRKAIKCKNVIPLPPGLPAEVKDLQFLLEKSKSPKKYVLTAARWDIRRRPDWVIEAAKRVKELNFIVLGYWQSQSLLASFLRKAHNLKNVIVLRGTISEEKLKHVLRRAMIVVRLNVQEYGIATIAWEAVHMGVPVIVNSELGVADYINKFKAGVVIPKIDPTLIEHAINEILGDYERYVRNCVKLASSYDVRSQAERLAKILYELY